jgi:hypothetical protein
MGETFLVLASNIARLTILPFGPVREDSLIGKLFKEKYLMIVIVHLTCTISCNRALIVLPPPYWA